MRIAISSPELLIGMSMLSINAWVKHVFHIKQILVTLIVLRAFPERLCQDLPIHLGGDSTVLRLTLIKASLPG